jgi:hypothetical protein
MSVLEKGFEADVDRFPDAGSEMADRAMSRGDRRCRRGRHSGTSTRLGLGKRLFVPLGSVQEVLSDSVFLAIRGFNDEIDQFKEKPAYLDRLHSGCIQLTSLNQGAITAS